MVTPKAHLLRCPVDISREIQTARRDSMTPEPNKACMEHCQLHQKPCYMLRNAIVGDFILAKRDQSGLEELLAGRMRELPAEGLENVCLHRNKGFAIVQVAA